MKKTWQERLINGIKISQHGCWNWYGGSLSRGYGRLYIDGKRKLSHRLMFEYVHGACPDYIHILHKCDNPLCCRPDHLFPGNNAINVADKISKGRQPKPMGEKNPNSILTEKNVKEIKLKHAAGFSYLEISKFFKVSKSAIASVIKKKNWGFV